MLQFLTDLAVWLGSFLPNWTLRNSHLHGDHALSDVNIQLEIEKNRALVLEVARIAPESPATLLSRLRVEIFSRLRAEGSTDPETAATEFLGTSLATYLNHV